MAHARSPTVCRSQGLCSPPACLEAAHAPRSSMRRATMTRCAIVLSVSAVVLAAPSAEAACTGASPQWSSTPDLATLQACVDGAARNDTIQVLAGQATWTGALNLTRGVTVLGAGRDEITIT